MTTERYSKEMVFIIILFLLIDLLHSFVSSSCIYSIFISSPFDRFTVPDSFKWGYAFYKLCALWHVVHRYEFDTYLELDTDTVTVGDLEPMWCDVETTKRVLLFNLHRSINHPVGTVINRDYHKIYTQPIHIDQLGGSIYVEQGMH